jgi:dimethylsulfone monooxygenase
MNPLYSDRKLKLGTFGSNVAGGCAVMTNIDGMLKADWPSTLTLARLADEMEFEAIIPVGRWRGYGGASNFHGPSFETYSWAAGIGASTKYSCVFSTSHVATIHPIVAAKQAVTIDHITGGRYALNVVGGWYRSEMEMFGASLLDHEARYALATEWLDIVKRLWSEETEFDYDGRYFRIKKGYLQPKPVQKPFPAVMNAGGSERGRHYAAKYCDIAFIVLAQDFEQAKTQINSYRELAWNEYRREIKIWTYSYVIQGETEQSAKQFLDYCVNKRGDWEAVTNLAGMLGMTADTMSPKDLQAAKTRLITGWGGYPLIGTKEQVAQGLLTLSNMGLDGVVLSWPRYVEDMRQFQQETLPLLRHAGLR